MAAGNLKKYLIDGLLIVFSVLFALFINNLAVANDTANKKETALKSIKKELERNTAIVTAWQKYHADISQSLNALVHGENEILKDSLLQYDYLAWGLLTKRESLIDSIVTSTAWESAKTTGIIAEFDFDTTRKLTNVYALQDNLMNQTIKGILDLFFDKDSHDMDQLTPTLVQFNLRFMELKGQENYILQWYEEALEDLE